jgi:hypothetical protein
MYVGDMMVRLPSTQELIDDVMCPVHAAIATLKETCGVRCLTSHKYNTLSL